MNKKGFTLLEVVLVVALTCMLIGGLSFVFRPMIKTFQLSNETSQLKSKAEVIINQLSVPLRTCTDLVSEIGNEGNNFSDEYLRNYLIVFIRDGILYTRESTSATETPLFTKEFYEGYKIDVKLSTVEKGYDSEHQTVEITLIFNKRGQKYNVVTGVECLNLDYMKNNFSVVLSDGYLAILK